MDWSLLRGIFGETRNRKRAAILITYLVCFSIACSTSQSNLKRAESYYSAHDYERAKSVYLKQIATDRHSGTAYYGLARTLSSLGDNRGAAGAFRRAIELLPSGSPEAQISRIQMAYSTLRFSDRPEDLEEVEHVGVKLCRADPRSFDGRRLLGALAFRRAMVIKDSEPARSTFFLNDALEEYRIATAVKPDDPESALGFARVLAVKGDLPAAERLLFKVVSLDGKNPGLYAELYRVLLLERKLADAREVLHLATGKVEAPSSFWVMVVAQAISTDPASVPSSILELTKARINGAHLIAGDAWYRAGDIGGAVREYRTCMADKRFVDACRSRLLQVALLSNDQAEAERLKNEILSKDSKSSEAQFADALLKVDSNDLQRAESEVLSVILHEPGLAQAHYLLSRIHMINGSSEQARQELEKAIRVRPGFLSARLALADLEFALGEYDSAHKLANELLVTVGSCGPVPNILEASEKARESKESPPEYVIRSSVQRLGTAQVDLAGEYLAKWGSSIKHPVGGGNGPTFGKSPGCVINLRSGSDSNGMYLKDSLVDEAIETFNALHQDHYDPWTLASPVPGRWM
jgi:tetratricopeptide (TPR) repeat protein